MSRTALALALSALALAAPPAAAAYGVDLGSLFSCDAAGSKNSNNALISGLVSGFATPKIAKNGAVGAAVQAGLGSTVGKGIGCKMDPKAAGDAQTAFQRALDTGQPQSWSDPANNVTGKVEVLGHASGGGPSSGGSSSGAWRFAPGVQAMSRAGNQGGAYAASSRVNVRAAPDTTAMILARLQPGAPVQVAGVVGTGWYAIERDGLIQGYVSPTVLRPSVDGPVGGGSSGGGGVVAGGGDCRLVQQTINQKGQPPVQQLFNACRDQAGAWQLSKV